MASQTFYLHLSPLRDRNNHANRHGELNVVEMDQWANNTEETHPPSVHEVPLPRADGGKDAWLFLSGCFVMEMLLWGFPFSFGIFQVYYKNHEPFSTSSSGTPIIGTTATGVMYLGSPVIFVVLKKWAKLRKWSNVFGLLIMVTALLLLSFAYKVWHLIIAQGVLYGVGGAMSYCPCVLYMDEWFVQKTGLAFGIMWAGTGLGGLIIPFIMNWSLENYGYRAVLRAWSVVLVVLLGPLVYYLKPRISTSRHSTSRNVSFGFLSLRAFWMYQIPNVIQGLGYFIPNLYLPSYASMIGLSSIAGPLTVALFNGMLVLGTIVLGAQIDKMHVTMVMLISALGAALSVLVVWGCSTSLPALCAFSMIYGFFAGAFSTCWTGIVKEIQARDIHADTGLVFGMFLAGRGVGNLASGPLSEALLAGRPWYKNVALGYGTGYGELIAFVGATALLSGMSRAGRQAGWV